MKLKGITRAGIIAAVYVCLTYLGAPFASGVVQVRLSEAMCILPVFSSFAVPGLFVGCFAANLVTGAHIFDCLFGSIATLIGGFGTYWLRNTRMAFLPPIISNTVIIPLILSYVYHFEGSLWWFALTVFAGEVISCGLLGYILYSAINKNQMLRKYFSD